MKKIIAHLIIVLMILSIISNDTHVETLDDKFSTKDSSSAVRVQITSPSYLISADEVVTFQATLYDSVNSVVAGNITWSSTNGTITQDGTFYPWSAGVITIQARHTNLTDSFNITVTAGIGQSLEISFSEGQVLQNNILTADLIDARGNAKATTDAAWSVDGVFLGQGNPVWIPHSTGLYELTARLYQMEVTKQVEVVAASPHEFAFPENLQIRSNSALKLEPMLLDVNGFEMNNTLAGSKTWIVENGSINSTGWYFSTHPGLWNVTVSAGAISGTGKIRVVPYDATTSDLSVQPDLDIYTAGEKYELSSFRTDKFGYQGHFTPPLENFSVSSGTLSQEDGLVYWTPMTMGQQTITMDDAGLISSVSVNVEHGNAIDTRIIFSPDNLAVGQQATANIVAVDLAGNLWQVDGEISVISHDNTTLTDYGNYYTLVPHEVGVWEVEGTWTDPATGIEWFSEISKVVSYGELSLITMNGQGQKIPVDYPFDLEPQFFDSYGNELFGIALNWTIDSQDQTLMMTLSDSKWIPTSIGSHEIQANAAGIFAIVSLTVSAGDARNIITEFDDGFVVSAGEATEIFIEISDSRQNLAPAEAISITLNESIGVLEPSNSGRGYWTFTGKIAGQYELFLSEDDAEHSIPLTINPGEAVQIFGIVDGNDFAQGDFGLLRVYGVDSNGNTIAVDPDNTTISCTSGSSSFVTGDTWEIEISKSGLDRSCNIVWNGLVAQVFFDVESVLLGGAIGSTNTAMTIAAILLGLILITMIVLVRRANFESDSDDEWFDDDYDDEDDYDDDEDDYGYGEDYSESPNEQPELQPQPVANNSPPSISDVERQRLAAEAGKHGVMQAIDPSQQGSSGWYVDVSGEIQYWNVGADGSWTRGV